MEDELAFSPLPPPIQVVFPRQCSVQPSPSYTLGLLAPPAAAVVLVARHRLPHRQSVVVGAFGRECWNLRGPRQAMGHHAFLAPAGR